MAVWFRHGPCTVGLEDGIVRAADFAQLLELQEAAEALAGERARIVRDAQEEAESILSLARHQAQQMVEEAQQLRQRAYAEGHEEGLQRAQELWAQSVLEGARASREAIERHQARLGEIVSQAVERVVEQEDRQAVFRRAIRSISKLVRDVPLLTLRVSTGDQSAAQRALSELVQDVKLDVAIEVLADSRLPDGSCRFESDQGVIDAGLSTQLAAIKRAVIRAAMTEAGDPDEGRANEPEPTEPDQTAMVEMP